MSLAKRIFLVLVVLIACVGCDQSTKLFAEARLPHTQPLSLLSDTVRLQTIHNPGAFLGLGDTAPKGWRIVTLRIGVAAFLLGLLAYTLFAPAGGASTVVALALVLSGGVGNLIDRFANDGYVVDFMNLGIGSLRTGIFNVADISITLGVLVLLVQGWRGRRSAA
jgi:signal peptidase II